MNKFCKKIMVAAVTATALVTSPVASAHSEWVAPFISGVVIGGIMRYNYPPAHYYPPPVIVVPGYQEPIRQVPTLIFQQSNGTCIVQQHDSYTNRVETYQVPCQRR